MKKILYFVMAVVVLFSLFSFRASRAQAAGVIKFAGSRFVVGKGAVFLFKASGFGKNAAKNATIFTGSNFYNLFCTVKKDDGLITCLARAEITQFGGETGIIHLAGQVFYVMVPYLAEPPEDEGEGEGGGSACETGVSGADVTFKDLTDGSTFTEFVPGETIEEVTADANSDPDLQVLHIGSLYCGAEPVEQPV